MPPFRAAHRNAPNRLLTVNEWLRAHSQNVDAVCPVCEAPVHVRAASSPSTTTHFSHYPNADCPTMEERRDPYRLLVNVPTDPVAGARLLEEVRFHMRELFLSCQALVEGFDFHEFRELLETATARDVWHYQGLTYGMLPFVLVTLRSVFEPTSTVRTDRFYFAFPATIRRQDDLWNLPAHQTRVLWRISAGTGDVRRIEVRTGAPLGEKTWVEALRRALP